MKNKPCQLEVEAQGQRVGGALLWLAPVIVVLGGTASALTLRSPRSVLVVIADGAVLSALLISAAGWGVWPAAWLGFRGSAFGRLVLVAVALGLGILSILTLVFGVCGALHPLVAWGLLLVGAGLGCWRLLVVYPRFRRGSDGAGSPKRRIDRLARGADRLPPGAGWGPPALARSLAMLPLVVPLALALFGATLPPGVLWAAEGRGYDVLEYHLQAPREYFEAGYIHFLPHNVYASFPQQVEMLYVLLVYLFGEPLAAAIPAQLLHLSLGVLAVAALAAWTTPGWPRCAVALAAGAAPWVAYLGALAYVELGVLFFGAVAAGITAGALKPGRGLPESKTVPPSAPSGGRSDAPGASRAQSQPARAAGTAGTRALFAAGLCAGLAGGCKYTALALVAAAIGVAFTIAIRAGARRRAALLAAYSAGVLLAFSPWLIRNAAFTGNPVYPFAWEVFGGRAWSAEQAAQWAHGHALPGPGSRTVTAVVDELFSPMFGIAIWALPAVAILFADRRRGLFATIWLGLIVIIWAGATHMPGRFAVPAILPLAVILGGLPAASRVQSGSGKAEAGSGTPPGAGARIARFPAAAIVGGFVLAAVAGAVLNAYTLFNTLGSEAQRWNAQTGLPLRELVDRPEVLVQANTLNTNLSPSGAYAWLVGEARVFYVQPRVHYTVAFNRDPWLAYAADAPAEAAVAWLGTRGVTHVVFSWAEIGRLRRTYGFPEFVTPEWAGRLAAAGLRRSGVEPDEAGRPLVEIYELPPAVRGLPAK